MSTSLIPSGVLAPVKSKCAEVVARFPLITHVYGYAGWPDHNTRRCIDFMVYNSEKPASENLTRAEQVKLGDAIAAYLLANRDRLDVNGIIWNRRVVDGDIDDGAYRGPEGGWRPYSGDDPHADHVHVEFGSAAYVAPSGLTSVPKVWLDVLVPGVTDSTSVRLVQRALGIPQTGAYDAATVAAVKRFQERLGDDVVDGRLGPLQTARLFAEASIAVEIRKDPSGEAPAPVVVPPVVPPKPPTTTPKPPTSPPPKGGTTVPELSLVFGNALRRTDPEAGGKRLEFDQRLAGILAAIRSGKPSLVLLNELDSVTSKAIYEGLGGSWTWERKNGIGVGWDRDVLERTGDAISHLFSDRDNRYLLSVPLRDERSGVEFWADVTHLENDGDPDTDGHAARFLQSSEIAARTGKGMRVFGGDLNSTSGATMPAKPTTRERQKPRRVLAAAGWSFLSSKRSTIPNGQLASHWGGRTADKPVGNGSWIDDVGARGGARILSGKLLRTDAKRCSDHHFLQATVALGTAVS